MKSNRILSCFLAIIWASSAIAADKATQQYFAIYMQGGKIGYVLQSRTQAPDGKVTTVEEAQMSLARAGMAITTKTTETCIETADGKPLSFTAVQDLGVMSSSSSGKIENGKLIVTTDAAGQKSTQTLDWPSGTVMSEGLRLLGKKHGLKAGTVYKAKVFAPSLMQPVDANVAVGPKKSVDLFGRIAQATEVTTTLDSPSGPMTQVSYVTDDFDTLKMTTNVMGMSLEMVACPKEFAMAEGDVVEFFSKVTVKSPEPLSAIGIVKAITYHISSTSGSKPAFPATDTQSVKTSGDGSILLTVTRPAAPAASKIPYAGTDPELLKAIKRSQYLESDDSRIIALAAKAVGSEKDAWQAAKKIEKFVNEYVADKNLSVGYASAAEVAQSRSGDCTEHAVLVAAMCRAVGIPARVTVGLVYVDSFGGQENIFGPHAWAEVNISGKWYGLDATGAPRRFAPDHIAVASGDGSPAAFIGIVNTIGNFTITKLDIKR